MGQSLQNVRRSSIETFIGINDQFLKFLACKMLFPALRLKILGRIFGKFPPKIIFDNAIP
jgi:hypothetical protein